MQVSKGLATWAGIIAAAGQYAAAVALFLEDPDKVTALGPLITATVTLISVIVGRMQQARAVTELRTAQTQESTALIQSAPPVPFATTLDRAPDDDDGLEEGCANPGLEDERGAV